MSKKKHSSRKSAAQKYAVRRYYASQKPTKRIEAGYPHFRYYKKSGHPALIVGEQKGRKADKAGKEYVTDEYRYRKVMHGSKDGERTNEMVYPNPNTKDPNPMYIGKRVRHDEKRNFEDVPLPWKYPGKPNKKQ